MAAPAFVVQTRTPNISRTGKHAKCHVRLGKFGERATDSPRLTLQRPTAQLSLESLSNLGRN